MEKKSKAEKKRTLFKKKKAFFGDYFESSDFKEPILILMRRNQKAEFFENATQGTFEYVHSDTTERQLFLETSKLVSFPYGKKVFKGYICHEDNPLPLPNEPEVTAETVGIAIDKTLNDLKAWKAKEWTAKGNFYWKIFMGIAALVGLYIIYRVLFPNNAGDVEAPVIETVKNTTGIIKPTILG